jgi:hypothetical protein
MGGRLYRPLAEYLLDPESPLTYAAHVFAFEGERETTRDELLLAAARAVVLCEQLEAEDDRPTLAIDRRGWKITYANDAALRCLPGRADLVGRCLWDVSERGRTTAPQTTKGPRPTERSSGGLCT